MPSGLWEHAEGYEEGLAVKHSQKKTMLKNIVMAEKCTPLRNEKGWVLFSHLDDDLLFR